MNTMNLTKRPLGAFPETSEQMVNLICINALDQAGIEHDKAEHWENAYYELRSFLNKLQKEIEVKNASSGKYYIRFNTIYESYDADTFDDAVRIFNLGAKIIELEANEEGTK